MKQQELFNQSSEPSRRSGLERVLLVDGHNLAFRSYYALSELTTSTGQPVQAIYGFMRTLLKLLAEDGHCVIVVFDAPAPSFRHEQFEDYKAQRAPTPPELRTQLDIIRELVVLLGLKVLELPGYEADDAIGTLAKQAESAGYQVRIISTDRDNYQLLGERISVLLPDGTEVGPAEVRAKYGVDVAQWVDYRALTGDASDNIPGAKGIGPKTAQKLLATWKSLDRMFAHLDEVTPESTRRKIEASLESIERSKSLSRIHTDLSIGIDFEQAHRGDMHAEALRLRLQELEFGSLLRELGLLDHVRAEAGHWPPPTKSFLGFALDRPEPMNATLMQLAAAWDQQVARGPNEVSALAGFECLSAVGAKDLAVLAQREGQQGLCGDDPLLLAYLYDPVNTEPASVVRRYTADEWSEDAAERAVASLDLWNTLSERLKSEEQLGWLYRQVERPLQDVLARMEVRGVRLDSSYLQVLSEELGTRILQVEEDVHRLAGHAFNLGSRDQLETVLYDELGLRPARRTQKTGKRSTAAGTLEALLDMHPIIEQILQYRELTKLKGTYLDPLPRMVNPRTGRLHTRFHQAGTTTGRMSSSDPNLQNIPVRTDVGRRIRKAFIASEGMQLVVADYSQIELRVLAHLSGDENLTRVFKEDLDIHTQTASWMFAVPADSVGVEQRRAAKTINFGVLYGMSAHRLSRELGIGYAEAEGFIERYFSSYPKVRTFMNQTLSTARERGYVETLFGRRRYVPELLSANRKAREAAERMAFNMPVQGTAADLMKLAMVRLAEYLDTYEGYLLLQVHDELVLEAPRARAEELAAEVERVMREVWPLEVPLEAEAGLGGNWLEAK